MNNRVILVNNTPGGGVLCSSVKTISDVVMVSAISAYGFYHHHNKLFTFSARTRGRACRLKMPMRDLVVQRKVRVKSVPKKIFQVQKSVKWGIILHSVFQHPAIWRTSDSI